jgi:hypothetical protein
VTHARRDEQCRAAPQDLPTRRGYVQAGALDHERKLEEIVKVHGDARRVMRHAEADRLGRTHECVRSEREARCVGKLAHGRILPPPRHLRRTVTPWAET